MRLEREDGLPRIVVRRFADGAEHAIAFAEEAYALGMSGGYEFDTTTTALHLFLDDDAGAGVRLRHGDADAHAAQDAGGAERARSGRLRHAPPAGARPRRRDGAGLGALPQGHAARRLGAAVPLRLRRLRHHHPRELLDHAPVPGRPRLRLRHRPYPRRQGQGLPLVYRTASSRRSPTPSRTSSPPASTWRRRATPGAGASSPTAARPAAC